MSDYLPRLLDGRIQELFAELPAILIVGPRASGKTTTARRHARTAVRLDQEVEATAFRLDPDAALRAQDEPVLLDEWQALPSILGAVKRAVDDDFRPGRFLMTGSVRADLEAETWPGTGRVVRLSMYGLTIRELQGAISGPTFLDRLAGASIDAFGIPAQGAPNLVDYVDLAVAGGFPQAVLELGLGARQAWLESYVSQVVTRDAAQVTERRDPARLARYLESLALSTAGIIENKTLYDAAGIDHRTAEAYDRLLRNLFIVDNLPAWSTNRLRRLVRMPKRYLVDPSLVTAVLNLDAKSVLRDGDILGRMIDTFVIAQIRPELALSPVHPRLYHLRNRDGREIDVVAQMAADSIVAVEIKATAAPHTEDARHLIWLRDELGDRFLSGAVLHTGPRPFVLSERIFALPICTLWG
jgi:uncharacterized protein